MVLALLILSAAVTGALAGASLDQSIKQLPARRRIGAVAFSRYSQAADLGNGTAFYTILGATVALSNVATAIVAQVQDISTGTLPIYAGAVLAILHSVVTAFAAPTNFSQRGVVDEVALMAIFDRFARLQALRCVLQVMNFGANLWALVAVTGN
jgi:hypothetical protein